MRWKPHKLNRDCAVQPLAELIRDELDEQQCERLATHLDECEACQRRLTTLAADAQWWLDASRWLDPTERELDACDGAMEYDYSADDEAHYSNSEKELLASGLLEPSDKAGTLGSLGRYEVMSVIGAGGTGVVLKAIDIELNRTVAIKVLSPALATSGAARRRFAREGQAVAAVAHENVVAVHQVEGNGRLPFLVMQYIDGNSLQELVGRHGPLDVTTALRMTAQIASALAAAHDQGLVHRDVKPANILVGAAGQRVWITDFGLARAVDDASLTRTGFIAGTPHYMSPEQARGEAVRASSDLFGLGSVLYFTLTGRPPFRADRTLAILSRICNEPHRPVREVNPDVPRMIADLVDRLLNKSADERIGDAHTVRARCLQLLAALAEPDGDACQIDLGTDRSADRTVSTEPGDRRRPLRRVSRAILVVTVIVLNLAAWSYLTQTDSAPLDQPDLLEMVADAHTQTIPIAEPAPSEASTNSASANTAFATRDSSDRNAANEQPGAFVAAAAALAPAGAAIAGTDAPHDRSISPQGVWRRAPSPFSPGASSESIGSNTVSPPQPLNQMTSEPYHQAPPQPTTGDATAVSGAFSVWAVAFDELRASLELFETQITQPSENTSPNSDFISPLAPDPFTEQLRAMEDSLRALESPAAAASAAMNSSRILSQSERTEP